MSCYDITAIAIRHVPPIADDLGFPGMIWCAIALVIE